MKNTFFDNQKSIGVADSALDFITVRNSDMGLVFMGQRKNVKCFDRLKKISERVFETLSGQTYKFLDKMPEPAAEPEPQISPERRSWLDGAYARYLAEQAAKATPAAIQPQPMSFEEKLEHDWKYSPAIRSEFVSFASYVAYKKAAEAGRCKVYGRG